MRTAEAEFIIMAVSNQSSPREAFSSALPSITFSFQYFPWDIHENSLIFAPQWSYSLLFSGGLNVFVMGFGLPKWSYCCRNGFAQSGSLSSEGNAWVKWIDLVISALVSNFLFVHLMKCLRSEGLNGFFNLKHLWLRHDINQKLQFVHMQQQWGRNLAFVSREYPNNFSTGASFSSSYW